MIRIVLGQKELDELVRGREVVADDGAAAIILADIGFPLMVQIVLNAANGLPPPPPP